MPELLVRDGLCISIHTPLAGSDEPAWMILPCTFISIHTPLAGSDAIGDDVAVDVAFQSTLPLRGATAEMRHF